MSQKTKVALAAAYFARARETVYAEREHVSEEQYERMLSRVTDAWTRGAYAFPMGESFSYYLGEGVARLVGFLTGCTPDEAEALVQERSIDVMHLCLCVVCESFPDLKKKLLALAAAGSPQMDELAALLSSSDQPATPTPTG